MGAAITAATSPIVNAMDRISIADEQPLGVNRLTLAPASIDKASAVLAANIQPTTDNLTGLFDGPDAYMNEAMDLLQPGPDGEPPTMANVLLAQQKMQASQILFQTLSEKLKAEGDNAKTAIKAGVE